MKIRVEWDPIKAAKNLRKHHLSFELAQKVFYDPLAIISQNRIEGGEHRWQTLGMVEGVLLLLVAHTVVDEGGTEVLRIISARRAQPRERRRYEQTDRSSNA